MERGEAIGEARRRFAGCDDGRQVYDPIPCGSRQAGIVVMASHGRGSVLRWVLGSTAEGLTAHALAPVLIVRGTTAPALNEETRGQSARHAG